MCRRASLLRMPPSYCIPLIQAGFNEEKANKVVITAAQVLNESSLLEMKTRRGVIWGR